MDEREKEIAQKIAEAVPKMDDFTKGYLLGQVEAMARQKAKEGGEEVEEGKSEQAGAG